MLVKPLAQFVRRNEISQPCMQRDLLSQDAGRPQPVNQNPCPIGPVEFFVNSLRSNLYGEHGRCRKLLYVGCRRRMAHWYHPRILMGFHPPLRRPSTFFPSRKFVFFICGAGFLFLNLAGCETERRKSDAELGLNSQQVAGRRIYDNYCDRCHDAYSSRSRRGPSLEHMFKKQYLAESGLPANDDRVTDIILMGRDKMPGFGQALNRRQVEDLLAYLHTL
jgi:mono/diheme cytochrome c family protein